MKSKSKEVEFRVLLVEAEEKEDDLLGFAELLVLMGRMVRQRRGESMLWFDFGGGLG